jgi:phosphoglycolate phosphatase-like HAD superfamily hydrolase
MKKLFVWDFHGTLEKGNELAALEISNRVLERFGYEAQFSEQDGRNLYGKKWYEYFEYLLPNETHETHVKLQEASFTYPEGRQIIRQYLKPNDFAIEVLQAVDRGGHDQIVISNTHPDALLDFIKAAGLTHYFGEHNAFAVMAHLREVKRGKAEVLKDYLQVRPVYAQIITIGDSLKDMELIDSKGGKGYLLNRSGRETPSGLESHIRIIRTLKDVLHEVTSSHKMVDYEYEATKKTKTRLRVYRQPESEC